MEIPVNIRKADLKDASIIVDFQLRMALESENLSLDRATVHHGVHAVFADPGKGQYYIFESEGIVVASLLTTYEWSDWRNKQVIWLQSVYVMPEFRQKGVFRIMFQYVCDLVKQSNSYSGIRLYVDQSNHNAINVYRTVGMNGEHYTTFEWMKDI